MYFVFLSLPLFSSSFIILLSPMSLSLSHPHSLNLSLLLIPSWSTPPLYLVKNTPSFFFFFFEIRRVVKGRKGREGEREGESFWRELVVTVSSESVSNTTHLEYIVNNIVTKVQAKRQWGNISTEDFICLTPWQSQIFSLMAVRPLTFKPYILLRIDYDSRATALV